MIAVIGIGSSQIVLAELSFAAISVSMPDTLEAVTAEDGQVVLDESGQPIIIEGE